MCTPWIHIYTHTFPKHSLLASWGSSEMYVTYYNSGFSRTFWRPPDQADGCVAWRDSI